MTTEPQNFPDAAVAPPPEQGGELSPGQVIRRARTDAGWDAEEFAAQIKLSRSTLEALENDDYATLCEPVYVRGYYRKCAKLLNLPEDQLIAAYERRARPKAPAIPSKIPVVDGGIETRGGGLRWLIVLIVLGGLFAAVAWYLQQESAGFLSTMESAGPAGTQPLMPPGEAQSLPLPAVGAPLVEQEQAPEQASEAPPDDAAAAGAPAPPSAPQSDQTPAPASGGAAAAGAGEAAQDTGPLSLRFTDNSWVRIEDGDGRLLMSGLARRGSTRSFDGSEPFSVFLGYAPGVEVRFNGQPVNLAPHTRDNNTANIIVPQRR